MVRKNLEKEASSKGSFKNKEKKDTGMKKGQKQSSIIKENQ